MSTAPTIEASWCRRREWFAKPEGPYHVLWWVEEGHRADASRRGLRGSAISTEHGPTPYAFTFKSVFPPVAAPVDLKPEPYCVGWA